MVYVISKDGKPLMPCENVIARLLLKAKKARVVKKEPFTIKLNYETTEYTQNLTLGVDTGSGTIGTAVSNDGGDILYMSNIIIRNDITNKMTQRAKYRRNRRNRKTRYRKPRFNNRKNSTKSDRFSPTMLSKLHSHIKEIEFIKSILPITKFVFETATFDTHLMKNPILANDKIKHWGYQKGLNYGFENTKAMILNRDNYTCQYCKGKHKDSKLEVHHIIFRSNGGSDEHDNLITLCHTCHTDLHDGKINLKKTGKKKGNLRYATQMNTIRSQLLKRYPEAIETFGYITKANRQMYNILKDHYLDACIIASGGKPINLRQNVVYIKRHIPIGDYQQTKGIRSEKRIPTGKIFGFLKFDEVKYKNQEYFIKGRRSSGTCDLMDIYGNSQKFTNPKCPKLSNMSRISARSSTLITSKIIKI